jgi:hypothetical protein
VITYKREHLWDLRCAAEKSLLRAARSGPAEGFLGTRAERGYREEATVAEAEWERR